MSCVIKISHKVSSDHKHYTVSIDRRFRTSNLEKLSRNVFIPLYQINIVRLSSNFRDEETITKSFGSYETMETT